VLSVQFGVVLAGTVVAAMERHRLWTLETAGWEFDATGFDRTDIFDALAVPAAAVLTYGLSVHADLGPVLASALVGLIVGLGPADRRRGACGSFVGMASPAVFPSLEGVALAGLLAGLAFVATAESFGGFGGKYGTLALFGCLSAVFLTDVDYAAGSSLEWGLAPRSVPSPSSLLSRPSRCTRGGMSSVVASAAVGVVAGIGFPRILPELGPTLAAVAFCASFVGMSSVERLETTGQVAGAGLVCGLVYLAVAPALAGAGGKLGTTAFISCLALAGALELTAVARSSVGRFAASR